MNSSLQSSCLRATAPRAGPRQQGRRRAALVLPCRTALVDAAATAAEREGGKPTSGLKHLSEEAKQRALAATCVPGLGSQPRV
jgi:hypothetical protein